MKHSKFLLLTALSSFLLLSAYTQEKQSDKIKASNEVLTAFGEMKENIPEQLYSTSEGIIIIPKMINAGFVVAGKRGKGISIVKNADGTWSNPVFVTLTGGSAGLQAGVQSVELILLFKQRETLLNISKGSFTLGGDVSVTAGPVGRSSSAGTDYKLEAEVYSYSKSKGLFAGISLNGSSLAFDKKSNKSFYGKEETAARLYKQQSKVKSGETKQLDYTLATLFK